MKSISFLLLLLGVIPSAPFTNAMASNGQLRLTPIIVCKEDLRARDGGLTVVEFLKTSTGSYEARVKVLSNVFGKVHFSSLKFENFKCQIDAGFSQETNSVTLNEIACGQENVSLTKPEFAIAATRRSRGEYSINESIRAAVPESTNGNEVGYLPKVASQQIGMNSFDCQIQPSQLTKK